MNWDIKEKKVVRRSRVSRVVELFGCLFCQLPRSLRTLPHTQPFYTFLHTAHWLHCLPTALAIHTDTNLLASRS